MKRFGLIIACTVAAALAAAGCESLPRPAGPGLAALRVHVIAEPKAGAPAVDDPTSPYGGRGGLDATRGAYELVDYDNLSDIVVWVEPAGAAGPAPALPAIVNVDAAKPATALACVACVGQRVMIQNRGRKSANFYSVSDGNDFDVGLIAPGRDAEFTVRSAGPIEVLSDSAKDPVAHVYAAPTRWVAMARSGGAADFNDLPPGPCKVFSWHPRLPGYQVNVALVAGGAASTSVKVGVNGLPKVGRR